MGIVDLFRPKWKHSDAEVRATAVQKLGPEEMEALVGIARDDGDPAVRRIAIKKIEDPLILIELAQSETDKTLQRMAADKANGVLTTRAVADDEDSAREALEALTEDKALTTVARTASLEAIREAALDRLTEPRAIAEVARSAGNNNTRLNAVRRIDDPAILRSIALSDDRKEICVAALEKISDEEALSFIAKKARIKSVRTVARRRLKADKDSAAKKPKKEQVQQKKLHARLVQLCGQVESLSRSKDLRKAVRQMPSAEADWQELGPKAPDDLRARYDKAMELFHGRKEQLDAHMEQQASEVAELEENLEAKTRICEMIEGLGGDVSEARLEAAHQEWDQIGPVPENMKSDLVDRFARACGSVMQREVQEQSLASLREGLETLCIQAEQLPDMRQTRQAVRLYKGLQEEWQELVEAAEGEQPDDALVDRFAVVEAQLKKRDAEEGKFKERKQEEQLQRLEALIVKVEELGEGKDRRAIERKLRDANNAFRKTSDLPRERVEELKKRFLELRDKLRTRLEELREQEEWKRWSNISRLEDLCKEVEGLKELKNHKEAAKRLRSAQARWKRVGPAPKAKSEALWKRFKGACDEVYAGCQEYFAQEDEKRVENLALKEELCVKVETLAGSTEWVETAEAIKGLQREWKNIGPAPRSRSDEVWKRFRAACDVFFDKRQEHLDEVDSTRGDNLKLKEELCEKAEALSESEDWAETADVIKGLQREWRNVGPVPRAKSDAIWRRFRTGCDGFFDRRDAHQDKLRQENLDQKEALCGELEALAGAWDRRETAEAAEVVTSVMDLRARYKQIGAGPRHREDAVWGQFLQGLERVITAIPEEFEGTDLAPSVSQKKKEELCQRVEEMIGPEVSTTDSAEQIAEQLRSALAANALKDGATDDPTVASSPADELKRIQAEWNRTGPVPHPAGQELWDRFKKACDKVMEAYPEEKPKKKGRPERKGKDSVDMQQNLARKEELCKQAEELAADEDCASNRGKIKKLQRQWKSVGPMPQEQAKDIWNRFRGACNKVLSESSKARKAQQEAEAAPAAEAAEQAQADAQQSAAAPEPATEPEAQPEPAPEPATEPEAQPEPAPEPATEPEKQPEPEPEPAKEPEP